MFLKISQISQDNTCVGVSFEQSCRPDDLQLYYKQTPTKVFSCEICGIFKNIYFEEHLRTTAFKHRSSFLEVFCKSSCSASTNNVMKYSFSAAVVPKVVSVTYDLSKIELHHWYFSKNFITSAEQRYWKMHLDGCFWGRIYFGNIPEWLLLKGSCKRYNDFRNSYIYFKVGIHLYNL